jgi:hypothetical protein
LRATGIARVQRNDLMRCRDAHGHRRVLSEFDLRNAGFSYLPLGVLPLGDGEVFMPPIVFPEVPWLNASLVFGPGEPPVPLTVLLEVPAEDPEVAPELALLPLLPPLRPPLLPPLLPPLPPPPPLCASASVEANARIVAAAIVVVSFMGVPLWFSDPEKPPIMFYVPALQRDRSPTLR